MLQVKRVYDPPAPDDGARVLVDRLWPRGLGKEAAHVDQWMRDCAPSDELRRWFAHDRAKWAAFKERYFAELAHHEDAVAALRALAARKRVTLLFGASDEEFNNAVALQEYLCKQGGHSARKSPGSAHH